MSQASDQRVYNSDSEESDSSNTPLLPGDIRVTLFPQETFKRISFNALEFFGSIQIPNDPTGTYICAFMSTTNVALAAPK